MFLQKLFLATLKGKKDWFFFQVTSVLQKLTTDKLAAVQIAVFIKQSQSCLSA